MGQNPSNPSGQEPGDAISPGGSRVIRYGPRTIPFQHAGGDSDLIGAITDHIARHIGSPDVVFHEILSDLVHIDVHVVAPGPDRPFVTLVTCGMSEAPMTVPEGAEEWRFAELLCVLPADWPVTQKAFEDERNYWPMRWLKMLARLPHEHDTWLGPGHTVPHGEPPEPFVPGTSLCSSIVLLPYPFNPDLLSLTHAGHDIKMLMMVPLTLAEQEMKLAKGAEALERAIEASGIAWHDLFRPDRPCIASAAVRKRRRWWPF